MLKRLELVGFKSFADKTVFDFSQGITAIVGPNGSGKSNIVDAVRWILGEQSAKSLRGGEMTDVIFNGSASRRSFGMAEVSITLDNSRGLLATDATEVRITRRVYRSGEGEYLINGQVCRLKDIKNLFLGTGAGAGAYAIIAQGQVDVMLQASSLERRAIFEEAAGISRYKAKKIETLRKLQRVDQNVERLRDIIDEVERQLRSVRLQAAKAQRYQEHNQRLRQLRLGVGLREFHRLTESLQAEQASLASLRGQLEQCDSKVRQWEEEIQQIEGALAQVEQDLHAKETQYADATGQINAQRATWTHEAALVEELEGEKRRLRRAWVDVASRWASLADDLHEAEHDLAQTTSEVQQCQAMVDECADRVSRIENELGMVQARLESAKSEHLEAMRRAAQRQNDAVTLQTQIETLERERRRLERKSAEAAEHLASIDGELEAMTATARSLEEQIGGISQRRQQVEQERDRWQQATTSAEDRLAKAQQQLSGLRSRAEVLEELERSNEGLGAGVAELLEMLGEDEEGGENLWREAVVGMVADLLRVRHEYAPLIDLALADVAQQFLVRDPDLLVLALRELERPFSGRVTFLPAADDESPTDTQSIAPSAVRMPGVVARADELVSCVLPEFDDLPRRILGDTYIVRDLETARSLVDSLPHCRLLTLKGELLEPDGTLTVGEHHAEAGVLSRKAELREVREAIDKLAADIEAIGDERDAAAERLAVLQSNLDSLAQEAQVLSEQLTDLRSRLRAQRERREGLHEEFTLNQGEVDRLVEEIAELRDRWERAEREAEQAAEEAGRLQQQILASESEIRRLDRTRQEAHADWTQRKVDLAKAEERRRAQETTCQRLRESLRMRKTEHDEVAQNLAACQQRWEQAQLNMLVASSQLAHWHVIKEQAQRQVACLTRERDAHRRRRGELADQLREVRSDWQSRSEAAHNHELRANQLRQQRASLTERLAEDYEVDLEREYEAALAAGAFAHSGSEDQQQGESTEADQWYIPVDIEAAEEEIAQLRSKLQRLGNVNLESLDELQRLENRAAALNTQYEDLTHAKRSLEEIIERINRDSKRLFLESFETIRGHFQELFRKLFGGGMADIVLEDENNVLECGIEIIARPPGKELRSISLLSGGEKTLTAVALLLAIFRSKPSPFCILDEVDAALDEANIDRFASVLREFLDRSHFIIITHAKRTMAAADVIYGITMQESGISKRVAVRFEDWVDEQSDDAPMSPTGTG